MITVRKGGASGVTISVTAEGFDQLADSLTLANLDLVVVMKRLVQEYTKLAQAEAVKNVSGRNVVWSGGTFIINRQTGKLARNIITQYPSALSGVVIATANYANAVHEGVPHPVDMKPYLMGKTVFIPFKTPYGNRGGAGPIAYPVVGNSNQDPARSRQIVQSIPTFSSGGKRTGSKFGIFRRVGPNTQGFIIPPRKGRPFMTAAAEAIEPDFLAAVQKAYANHVNSIGRSTP